MAPRKPKSRGVGDNSAGELERLAKEINVRLSKVDKMEGQARDHRLTVCLELAEAKAICKASGQNFNQWAEDHINYSPETIRKYARIGGSRDPQASLDRDRRQAALGMQAKRKETEGVITTDGQGRHRRTQAAIAVDRFSRVPEHQRTEVLKELLDVDPDATTEALKQRIRALKMKDRVTLLLWQSDDLGVELSAAVAKALGIEKRTAA